MNGLAELVFAGIRYALPVCAIAFIVCAATALLKQNLPRIHARFASRNKDVLFDVTANESVIGSGPLSDVRIEGIEPRQALLIKNQKGFELFGVSGLVKVENEVVETSRMLESGEVVCFNGNEFMFYINRKKQETPLLHSPFTAKAAVFLVVFQALAMLYYAFLYHDTLLPKVLLALVFLVASELVYVAVKGCTASCSVVLTGFFLTTIGLMASGSGEGAHLFKMTVCAAIGFAAFLIFGLILKNVELCRKLRYPVGILAALLMLYNAFFGTYINGAKNWIYIGDFASFQPSELVKAIYIFCTAAVLNELITKKNFFWFAFLTMFFGFCLAMMRDFGTASIYFVTAMIITSMRTKSRKTIYGMVGAAFAFVLALINLMPYVSARFAVYRNVWDYAYEGGYQQTRTMIAIGSGGFFGLGGGNGNLIYVSAADTDLIFGVISEEWGLIVSICAVLCYALLLFSCIRHIGYGASGFYSVAGCSAAGLFLFQASLNVFGSVDLLPLTGVALPFVSNGGSAMLSSWLLLAFITAYLERCGGEKE